MNCTCSFDMGEPTLPNEEGQPGQVGAWPTTLPPLKIPPAPTDPTMLVMPLPEPTDPPPPPELPEPPEPPDPPDPPDPPPLPPPPPLPVAMELKDAWPLYPEFRTFFGTTTT